VKLPNSKKALIYAEKKKQLYNMQRVSIIKVTGGETYEAESSG
jgi:hypothetical protein